MHAATGRHGERSPRALDGLAARESDLLLAIRKLHHGWCGLSGTGGARKQIDPMAQKVCTVFTQGVATIARDVADN